MATRSRPKFPESKPYIDAVVRHSHRTKHSSLFPGQNYKALADFLSRSSGPPVRPRLSTNFHCDPTYVTIHEYDEEGNVNTVKYGPSNEGLAEINAHPKLPVGHAQIIFMRGFLAPEWLSAVGSRFRVDPEFFRRHIDFIESKEHFDLPPLPSAASHIIRLPILSIGTHSAHSVPATRLRQVKREDAEDNVVRYLRELDKSPEKGQSIIRKVSLHDENYFTIEQDVSVCIQPRSEGWNAIIWTDCGREMDKALIKSCTGFPEVCMLPTFQHRHKVALSGDDAHKPSISSSSNGAFQQPIRVVSSTSYVSSDLFQSASLLHTLSAQHLDHKTVLKDAFYAITELFTFVAFSSSQYLNLIAAILAHERSNITTHNQDLTHMDPSLATLQYMQALLMVHNSKLASIITGVKSRGGPKWPRALPETHPREAEIANTAAALLLVDFEHLATRAALLATQCADQSMLLMNRATLDIAQRGILQSDRVRWLTLLAFLFLPLGVTTSFFGMNFAEFDGPEGPRLSIWIWFAISLPVFAISFLFCFWKTVMKWLKLLAFRCC